MLTTMMMPCHDHGPGDYMHDPRCSYECGPCGGTGGVDTWRCLTCGGSGACQGCNLGHLPC